MHPDKEETYTAYFFGGMGVLLLAGGVYPYFILVAQHISAPMSLLSGVLSVGMGLFLCRSAYRVLTARSRPPVEKQEPSSSPQLSGKPTMTCAQCTATISTKANFCPRCGCAISQEVTAKRKVPSGRGK